MSARVPSHEGRTSYEAARCWSRMEPWQRAGVTHEEWVAARLKAAALVRAIEDGDPEAVAFILRKSSAGETRD